MARTVIAVFESVYVAKKAVSELLDTGYPREKIDLFANPTPGSAKRVAKTAAVHSEIVMDELRAGGAVGAGIGGSLGITSGLLAGFGAMQIPFLNAVTGGSLTILAEVALFTGIGVAAGAIAGSMLGGLVGLGIPENEVLQYAKTVRKSKVSVMVVADADAVDGTIELLEKYNPLDIQQRAIEWLKAGDNEKSLAERALNVKVTEQDRFH